MVRLENPVSVIKGWWSFSPHRNCVAVMCGDKREDLRNAMMEISRKVTGSESPYLIVLPGGGLFSVAITRRLPWPISHLVERFADWILAAALRIYQADSVVLISHGDCKALPGPLEKGEGEFHLSRIEKKRRYYLERGFEARAFFVAVTLNDAGEIHSMRWHG